MHYRTKDGDRLDTICQRHYGHLRGVVEAVLDANPGLADAGPVLRSGAIVILPVFPEQTVNELKTISLWGE